ncbi:ricin-type beta-trefoil lectin domain protein [Actinoplanes sp. CA-030573]|uniref:ricin-type beta-trefoil lectin domain protein n=1 Tax=Actinoplanes sp. CA-030573 TaxID=3239898 RepID=UPI003D92722C
MTDEDHGEERDPLLVRPYLRDSDASGDDRSTQTWPSATTREVRSHRALEGADDPTAVLLLPGVAKRKPVWDGRRRLLVLIAACAVVLIGLGAAGFAALRSNARPAGPAALPDAPIPALSGLVPTATSSGAAPGSVGQASGSPGAKGAGRNGTGANGSGVGGTGSDGTGSGGTGLGGTGNGGSDSDGTGSGATGTGTNSGGTGTDSGGTGTNTGGAGTNTGGTSTNGAGSGGTGSPTAASPSAVDSGGNTSLPAALAPKPADDRIGTIRGQNGLCLDLNGAVAVDFNHVQVFTCNGTVAQSWTLATDGTLRVMGMCALVAGDGTVHVTGCDGRTTAQWRADGQLLVNVSDARCLTDPSSGAASGTGVTVATCSGRADQRWSLP